MGAYGGDRFREGRALCELPYVWESVFCEVPEFHWSFEHFHPIWGSLNPVAGCLDTG